MPGCESPPRLIYRGRYDVLHAFNKFLNMPHVITFVCGFGYAPRLNITLDEDPPTLTVSDNGPGIAPENIERVFRPFWSLKEKGKRRGLGLFVARDHATSLGATLTLSDKPDRETGRLHEFILELPESAVVK